MSRSVESKLHCILSKDMKMNAYVVASLFNGSNTKYEKHIAKLDIEGNANLHFKDVYVNDCAALCFQVFIRRKLLPDKHVGTLNVRVSDLVSSPATYEFATSSSRKTKKVLLEVSCKVSMSSKDLAKVVPSYLKPEMESKHVASAIGNDIGLFKMVPSFRTPLVSLNWC